MDEKIEDLSKMFKALGDPSRLRILKLLHDHKGALCVTALAVHCGISQSAVSQHLRILKSAGLVRGNRAGSMMHYYIDREVIDNHKLTFASVFDVE